MKQTIVCVLLAIGWCVVPRIEAQEAKPPAKPAESHRFSLMDGSVVTGRLAVDHVTVTTPYGALKIPAGDIRSIVPGLSSHPDLAKRIDGLIADLGAEDFKKREKAQQALVAMGPTIRGVLEARRKTADAEAATRISAVLEEFEELLEDAEDTGDAGATPMIDGDAVRTARFTVVGAVAPKAFKVVSAYGTLNLRLADLKRCELITHDKPEPVMQRLVINGTHIVNVSHKKTGIRVQRGDRVSISATGTITLTPWGNNAASTPEGRANSGWYVPNKIAVGALVVRIGSGGQVAKAGSKTTFVAKRAGQIELAFAMTPNYSRNYNFPGEYKVKIRVEPGK